jgi:hypothetical protein
MVETMLKALRTDLEMPGKIGVQILDQGDAVAVWNNESLLVVLFPTGDTLNRVSFDFWCHQKFLRKFKYSAIYVQF